MSMATPAGPERRQASLGLRLHGLDIATSMGAVATLRRVADENGHAVRGVQPLEALVPGDRTQTVTVEPGRWLIEATLPSGETISTEVPVQRGQAVDVPLRAPERSPHEWLGWQHLAGNVEGAATSRQLRERAARAFRPVTTIGRNLDLKGLTRTTDATFDLNDPGLAGAGSKVEPVAQSPVVRLLRGEAAPRGAEAWTRILAPDTSSEAVYPHTVQDRDEATWLYRFDGPEDLAQRQFARVEWGDQGFVVSLPLPWRALSNRQRTSAQMMVRRHPLDGKVQIGVLAEDPDFAPLAGLMTASTLPKAAVAARQAYDMLFQKDLNPLGAAAGGYILLAAGEQKGRDWHWWIDNLNNWFPEIPDGAILKASLRLRFPEHRNSAAEAREALLHAFDRGIPYFSAGVSWLLDGLTTFADDPDMENKMRIVQRVALRLDLSQAFTVIRTGEQVPR